MVYKSKNLQRIHKFSVDLIKRLSKYKILEIHLFRTIISITQEMCLLVYLII